MMIVNFGFKPKRPRDDRLPPGQYETKDFPVLSLGPTPHIDLKEWRLKVWGLAKETEWDWESFQQLPMVEMLTDIHCVTKWSKFDTVWSGVPIAEIMQRTGVPSSATHLIAHSYDGYSTNVPLSEVLEGNGMVAVQYDHQPIPPEHGGPARLFIPKLYFWKSAKWLNGLEFTDHDEPGFWETRGYHNHGDPWKEERYNFAGFF